MPAFAERLRAIGGIYLDAPVVDSTGLAGSWDFELAVVPAPAQAAAGDGDTIFTALNKLGLELRREDVPTPAIIIDRGNQQPSDNPPGAAKTLAADTVAFEVASIRPVAAGSNGAGGVSVPQSGLVNLRGMTLRNLIAFAWDTDNAAVVGAFTFLDADRFDVSALVPPSVARPLDADGIRPMLRVLLQERFGLATHKDEQLVRVPRSPGPDPM